MSKESLLQLHSHRVRVRVWSGLDKVSVRARFDRPKAIRLPVPPKQGTEQLIEAEDSEGLTSGVSRPEKLPVVHQEKGRARRGRRTRQLIDGEEMEESEPQEGTSPSHKSDPTVQIVVEENKEGGVELSKQQDSGADPLSISDPGRLGLSFTQNLPTSHDDLSLSASSALKGW